MMYLVSNSVNDMNFSNNPYTSIKKLYMLSLRTEEQFPANFDCWLSRIWLWWSVADFVNALIVWSKRAWFRWGSNYSLASPILISLNLPICVRPPSLNTNSLLTATYCHPSPLMSFDLFGQCILKCHLWPVAFISEPIMFIAHNNCLCFSWYGILTSPMDVTTNPHTVIQLLWHYL